MDVTNTFEKVSGHPVDVSVWSVAQMREPKMVAFPIRPTPEMPDGFNVQMGSSIPSFRAQNGVASFMRDLEQEHKIGTPANSLLWVGDKSMMHMQAENLAPGRFPDGGSATEIYTNNKITLYRTRNPRTDY